MKTRPFTTSPMEEPRTMETVSSRAMGQAADTVDTAATRPDALPRPETEDRDGKAGVGPSGPVGLAGSAEGDVTCGAVKRAAREAIWWPTLRFSLGSFGTVGVAVAAVDTVRTVSSISLMSGQVLTLLAGLTGFYVMVAFAMGLVGGLVVGGVREALHNAQTLNRQVEAPALGAPTSKDLRGGVVWLLWQRLRKDEAFDLIWASRLSGGALSAALPGLMVFFFHTFVSSKFANEHLVALYLAGMSTIGVGLAVALFFPARAFTARLLGVVPRAWGIPRTVLLSGVAFTGALSVTVAVLSQADWRMSNMGPALSMVLLLVTELALLVVCRIRWRGAPGLRRGLASGLLVFLLGVGGAGGVLWSARAFNGAQKLRVAAIDRSWTGGLLLGWGRKMTDGDGDGFSAYFGGGDCDDSDPSIHPGANDPPGDGIDQDCLGEAPITELERVAAVVADHQDGAAPGGDARGSDTPSGAGRRASSSPPLRRRRFNILFLFVDALRADRLSLMGGTRKLTPNLDRFLGEAVTFTKAYSQGNRTPQSFTSLITSRYPSMIALSNPRDNLPRLRDENITRFERLALGGFRNVAVLRHYYFHRSRNLGQGFHPGDWVNEPLLTVGAQNEDISAPDVTDRAIRRLHELRAASRQGAPFSILVHYHDPHHHYVPHPEVSLDGPSRGAHIDAYDREVKFTDRHVGRLLRAVDELGLRKNTLVVLFSDHGETFGERSFRGMDVYYHGHTLYNELLRVPLAFRVPGTPGRVVPQPVMLLDMAPTVLDLVGLPRPKSFQGQSLMATLTPSSPEAAPPGALPPGSLSPGAAALSQHREIRAESLPYANWTDHMVTLIQGRWKLIYRINDNIFHLFDLEDDPGEKHNLASSRPKVLNAMKRRVLVR